MGFQDICFTFPDGPLRLSIEVTAQCSHSGGFPEQLNTGPGSSVGLATDYGLDGPGIESRWGEIFRPSRPALGPT